MSISFREYPTKRENKLPFSPPLSFRLTKILFDTGHSEFESPTRQHLLFF